jgi:phosphatidylglycerophosphate synthase
MAKEQLNYFSESEKKSIGKFKDFRTKIFLPISRLLNWLRITPNMVSYFGMLMLVGFIYFIISNPLIACVFLFLHVIIDAFDGPLARLTGKDGDAGAFTDIVCDHSGMFIVSIALIYYNFVDGFFAAIYIYIYTIMILLTIIRNKMKIPAKLVIRSKYYLYLLYGVWAFFGYNYMTEGMILFTLLMLPVTITSFFAIRERL